MRWRGGSSGTNGGVREPAVAGQFYAGRSERLAAEVDGHLAAARKVLKASDAEAPGAIGTAAGPGAVDGNTDRLIAVVAPHAVRLAREQRGVGRNRCVIVNGGARQVIERHIEEQITWQHYDQAERR